MKTKEIISIAEQQKAPSGLSSKIMERIVQEPSPAIRKNMHLLGVNQRRGIIIVVLILVLISTFVAFNSQSDSLSIFSEKIGSIDFSGFTSLLSDYSFSSNSLIVLILISTICFLGIDLVLNKRLGGSGL